jgi:selenocysteine-specific elongation factor
VTLVVGTAGHIDHGKTTLLRALTGIDADRLPEERRRGMTIDVGYAHLMFDDGTELDFVDVPGHDRLVGNMLVGAGEIDAAMLVVAADDGPRAQTLEHLALLDALGVAPGMAVVTKRDVAGVTRTDEVVAEVRRLLDRTSLAGSPVHAVSSTDGTGIEAVRLELERLRDRAGSGRFDRDGGHGRVRLAIDRVFGIKGRGVVVTGTLRGGPLARGTSLRVVPGGQAVRVRDIQVHGRAVEAGLPGRTALNVAGVDAGELHRGLVLTDDPTVVSTDRLLVELRSPMPDRARARLHVATAATDATIGRSGRDAIDLAKGRVAAIVRLSAPVAAASGDRFVVRRGGSGSDAIVGGVVLDPTPARGVSRRRQTRDRVVGLAGAVHAGDEPAIRSARLELLGVAASEGDGVALATDVADTAGAAVLDAVGSGSTLTAARAAAARSLRRLVTIDRSATSAAAQTILEGLVGGGRLETSGSTVRPAGTAPEPSRPDPVVEAAMDRLVDALATEAPPALGDAARAAGCPPQAIRDLERDGRIVVLEPDLAYAATTYRTLEMTALSLAATAPLTPAALRDATGTSRKYVLAILADLDRRGILRRTPDGHVPGSRAALAGRPG